MYKIKLFLFIGLLLIGFNISYGENSSHLIKIGNNKFRYSIGATGVVANKTEGDGGTPLGSFKIRRIYYRPDRIDPKEIKTLIPLIALSKNDGWCDDINSAEYNKFVKLPFKGRHEKLWRDDHVYDIIGVLSYNDDPIVKGKGSAIFLHIARKDYSPTSGCIALSEKDLLNFIALFSAKNKIKTNLSGDIEIVY